MTNNFKVKKIIDKFFVPLKNTLNRNDWVYTKRSCDSMNECNDEMTWGNNFIKMSKLDSPTIKPWPITFQLWKKSCFCFVYI